MRFKHRKRPMRARARASSPTGNPARSSAAGSDEPRRRGDVDAIAMTTAD
jgi:hypothetical protein